MHKGIFITGTDTGVGKTVVSAAIIRTLMKNGIRTGAMKPLETGCLNNEGRLLPPDGIFLREAACMEESIDLVAPVCFELPLAPAVASELEKKPVELDRIMAAYEQLSGRYDFMIVEGVGGLMVPIAPPLCPLLAKGGIRGGDTSNSSIITHCKSPYFVIDLIKDLELPVVVVARASLGTINHTLLTVEYALREGIKVLGVIINHSVPPDSSAAEKTNPEVLREICPVPVIGVLPYIKDVTMKNIEEAARGFLDLNALEV